MSESNSEKTRNDFKAGIFIFISLGLAIAVLIILSGWDPFVSQTTFETAEDTDTGNGNGLGDMCRHKCADMYLPELAITVSACLTPTQFNVLSMKLLCDENGFDFIKRSLETPVLDADKATLSNESE